jgi:hypothetical protein
VEVAVRLTDMRKIFKYFFIKEFQLIDNNEIGGSCGAYGGGERCAQGVGGEDRGKEVIG